ncbi:MAG: site-2 protease family protein, partial [Desulforhopalus sp.]|jgi:regulator of sigma E protease|nr:site-2 protease family protein [Desulforhopalus sp.]
VLDAVKASDGEPISVVVDRDGEQLNLTVSPAIDTVKNIFGEEVEQRYMIGIAKADELTYERSGPISAFRDACQQTWMYISLTVLGIIKIFQQVVPASELGGPILIAQIAGEQMKAGWLNLIYFTGLLSVNLGILNLLPIPVLDGGHLVFLTIEAVRRKPLAERAQIIAQQIGIGLLGTLMIFVFYNDIVRLFS